MSEKDKCPRCSKNGVVVKLFGRTTKIGMMPNHGATMENRCGLCGWYSLWKSCGHRYQLIEISTKRGVEKYPMKCPAPECDPDQGKGHFDIVEKADKDGKDDWYKKHKNDGVVQ